MNLHLTLQARCSIIKTMPLDQGKIWSNNNAFAAHPDTAAKPLGCYLLAHKI